MEGLFVQLLGFVVPEGADYNIQMTLGPKPILRDTSADDHQGISDEAQHMV
jgi:hypothetical protein